MYSSRGPKSAQDIKNHCKFAANQTFEEAGDAGFLVPSVFPESNLTINKHRLKEEAASLTQPKDLCVIPHHAERNNIQFRKVQEELTMALQTCQSVVSTSVHGIILSEALGVPNRRLRLSGQPGDSKIGDFYEPEHPINLTHATKSILPPFSYEQRDAYARRVLKTFPIHVFKVQQQKEEGSSTASS